MIYHDRREITSVEFPSEQVLWQEGDEKRYADVLVPQAISQL
jgi:hypothetical protein